MAVRVFHLYSFGILLLYLFLPDVFCVITVAPKNTAAQVGASVTLTCAMSGTPVSWQFYRVGFSLSSSITTTDTNQRVHIDNTGGNYNLVITSVQNADAGRYVCQEATGDKNGCSLGVLGSLTATHDKIGTQELVSGTNVKTTCSATFIAKDMLLTIEMTDGTNANTASSQSNTGSTPLSFQNSLDVTAALPQVPEMKCNFFFKTDSSVALEQGLDASDTSKVTVSRNALTVSECAKATSISPKLDTYVPGQVLKCVATGYPAPTYRWVDTSSGTQLSTSQELTLSTSLPLNQQITYQCFARNTLTTVTCTESSIQHTFIIELSTTAAPVTQAPTNSTASGGIKWNNLYLIPILLIPLLLLLLGLLLCLLCGVCGPISEICKLPARKPKPKPAPVMMDRGSLSFYQAQGTKGRMDPTFRPPESQINGGYRYPNSYRWMDPNDVNDVQTFNNMGYVGSTQSVYTAPRDEVF